MKQSAMQIAIKEIAELWSSPSDTPTYTQIFNILENKLEMEKEQSDNLAICFSEWCLSELLNGNEPKAETMQGLLEIFKNK